VLLNFGLTSWFYSGATTDCPFSNLVHEVVTDEEWDYLFCNLVLEVVTDEEWDYLFCNLVLEVVTDEEW